MTARRLNGSNEAAARADGIRATRPTLTPLAVLPEGARDLRELPVDRYQRLRLAADCLRRLFAGRPARVMASVADAADLEAMLVGEAFEWEVAGSGSADALVVCDGLAGVSVEGRQHFLDDAARRVRGAVVVVGTFRTDSAGSNGSSASALVELAGELGEGTMDSREELERSLERAGLEVTCLGHGDPTRALALACASQQPSSGTLRRDVNELLYRAEPRAPFLRHAVVGWRGEVSTSWMDELRPSFESARGLDAFEAHLALRLDALRLDVAQVDATHSEAVRRVAELEATLERVRAEAAEAAELASSEFETLRAELAELRTTAIREVGEARNALEAERDARHASAERHEASRAEQQAFVAAESARHREQLAKIEAEHKAQIDAARSETADFDALLKESRQEAARLRAELKGRLGNLRRALSPRSPRD